MSMQLPYPGSMEAYVELIQSYEAWCRWEVRFDKDQTAINAKCADSSWLTLIDHAKNCGMPLTEPSVRAWIEQKIITFAASVPGMQIEIGKQ